MKRLRNAVGVASLILFIGGLNLLILRENLFELAVLAPLGGGLLLGVLWLLLSGTALLRRGEDSSASLINAVVSSILFLGICMTAYAFVEREDFSWDLTQEGRRDLAPQTISILQSLTNSVDITCFFVRSADDRVRVAQDKTKRFLERCLRYTDRLNVEFIDPQRNPERVEALQMLRVSNIGTIVLKSGARQREIPLSDVNARLEERDFTNALLNVSRDSIPKVYFLSGHGERDITSSDPKTGSENFRLWLEKEAYDVGQWVIPVDNASLPEDCEVLVINGPKADLRPYEIEVLDQFIDDGGRLFILINVQIVQESEFVVQEQLRPWLEMRLGIRMGSDIIVSNATNSYRIMFVPDYKPLGDFASVTDEGGVFRGSFNGHHPITRTLDKQLMLPVIRSVTLIDELPEGVRGDVLMRSTPDTWAETDLRAVIDGSVISQDPGEISGPNPVMVAVATQSRRAMGAGEGLRDARVVVLGDADISTNEAVNHVSNQDLLLNSIAWLTENEELIAIRPTAGADQPLILSRDQQRMIAWIASLGAVQAIALSGVIVFLFRRRYR